MIFTRPRGLHLHQAGVLAGRTAACIAVRRGDGRVSSGFQRAEASAVLLHSEIGVGRRSALVARSVPDDCRAKGLPANAIKCMALVESHPLAFQMEEFAWNLREHILGLNLGRWDYMASLIHFNLENPEWVLPDRNTIPHNVAFFQNLRKLMPEICHKHGMLAIGGMTALYPSREDAELNARALKVLAEDKKNEVDFA